VKHRGPLITLLVVLGALVLVLSLNDALIPNQAAEPGAAPTATEQPTGEPHASAEAVYVGKDEVGKMAVAIAIKDGKAVGYLCDGKSIEAWLTGTATDGHVALEAPKKDATIYGDFNGDGATGIAVVGDDEFDFAVDPAKPPAGLYRKKDDKTTIGWIVLPDGSQVGVANTNGTKKPAPEFDPVSGDADAVTGETR
jgi:hypothetical protein